MGQITTGIRRGLNVPIIYDLFQRLMGADRGRRELVRDHIRPISGMSLLDIGCGTARILDYLPTTIDYYGLDSSSDYINQASLDYRERGVFRCGSIEDVTLKDMPPFDLVLAISVLHHLDDAAAINLFHFAKDALRPGGRLVTIDPCFDEEQTAIAHFLVSKDRGENIRDKKSYSLLASGVFNEFEGLIKHRSWIPYTHWIMECVK